jgi:isoleucyl-tRNA synthetase
VLIQDLPPLEKYMMSRLNQLQSDAQADYAAFRFRAAARKIVDFCAFTLSSFYCDILKDRLYTFATNHPERRAAQTVLAECLNRLLPLAAPILPFTMEEAWQEGPKRWGGAESVLLTELKPSPALEEDKSLSELFSRIIPARAAVQKKLEESRSAKVIGSSLEAKVRLTGKLPEPVSNWEELLIVSQVEIFKSESELQIEVSVADGAKCPRCWRYQADIGTSSKHPELCGRCAQNLG